MVNFFDKYSPKRPKKLKLLPPRAAGLIGQINRHPPFLGILGILPNQFRTLLKESGHEHREDALLDLSRTLFYAGFRIWTKRQLLAKQKWNDIEKIRMYSNSKKKGRKRKYEKENKIFESNCTNPFHYLKRYNNLSKQRPTRCHCRNIIDTNNTYINQPITVFVNKYQRKNNHNFDDQFRNNKETKQISQNNSFITQATRIRQEHDRGKKRSLEQSIQIASKNKKSKLARVS